MNKSLLLTGVLSLLIFFNAGAQSRTPGKATQIVQPVIPADGHIQSTATTANGICGTPPFPEELEAWIQEKMAEDKANGVFSRTQAAFNIPLVVHVIHNGEAVGSGSNISDAQINSQITLLNKVFSKTNTDWTKTPAVWQPPVADMQITFCLAKINPSGQATTGIDRINRNTRGWAAPPYSSGYFDPTIKPVTIWNPNKYLNIWVTDLGGSVLGYAYYPPSSSLADLGAGSSSLIDGAVIEYLAFGTTGNVNSLYNGGKTTVHEIGHCLGLHHIWGDAACGSDYCPDTPPQYTMTSGCPSYPYGANNSCGSGANGVMFMNYMDYAIDACSYMFTNGQKARVQTVMTHSPFRVNEAASTVCNSTAPSPPVADFTANKTIIPVGGSVNFTDLSTNIPTSWSWSFSGGTPSASTLKNPSNIIYNTVGTYNVTLTAANSYGSNGKTKTAYITVTPGGGCDTLINLTANSTLSLYAPSATDCGGNPWGFVSGHNCFNDIGKADKFTGYNSSYKVKGVILGFGKAHAANSSSTFNVRVWNNNGTGGAPNSVLGSQSVTYATAQSDVTNHYATLVNFATPVTVGSTGFYCGIQFAYTNPTDTLALITNRVGESNTNTAWELQPTGWFPYSNTPYSWGISLSHYIIPVMCSASPTGFVETENVQTYNVFPNPNPGSIINVLVNLTNKNPFEIIIYDVFGKTMQTRYFSNTHENLFQLDASSFANGFYFVTLKTGDETHTQRIILAR